MIYLLRVLKRKPYLISLFLLLLFLMTGTSVVNAGYLQHVWPLSWTTTPDLPMSSAFGPRLQASANYAYDFHRGVDIPTPIGTPVHAIADGVVRLAGSYPYYSDPLVQIRHYKPGSGPMTCSNRGCYYSNYMHLSAIAVSEGANVHKGDIIGYTGASESGFAHLHFEIRDNGIYQKNCINPWKAMPYHDTVNLTITLPNPPDFSDPLSPKVDVQVTSPSNELDFNMVEVRVFDISNGTEVSLASQVYDMESWNYLYTPIDNPDQYLNNPDFNGVTVSPAVFNASKDTYLIRFLFHDLHLSYQPQQVRIRVTASDVKGNIVETHYDMNL